MFIRFYEYNVTPNYDDKNEYGLCVKFGQVYINGNKCLDKEKAATIINLCNEKFVTAVKLAEEENHPYRGGRQRLLTMSVGAKRIELCASGTNEAVRDFYNNFRREIEQILSK